MNRQQLRELEKQMLVLRAEQFRLDLREHYRQISGRAPSDAPEEGNTLPQWLQSAPELLALLLPARWQRRVRSGLFAWKLARVLFRTHASGSEPGAT